MTKLHDSPVIQTRLLGEPGERSEEVRTLLEAARRHLDMDLAFLGEFVDGHEIYRMVVGDGSSFGLVEGSALPLADTYCQVMIEGRMGQVIPDTALEPATAALQVTTQGDIGRYVGVPVRLLDGRLYGALCGLGHQADPTLRPRDARLLEFLAEVVGVALSRELEASQRQQSILAAVTPLPSGTGLSMVFQPIVDLSSGATVGFEALARFSAEPLRPPNVWFAEAAEVGLGIQLELTAISAALRALDRVPPGAYLSVNASAETACSPALTDVLAMVDLSRIVLEIPEHAAVANYEALAAALAPLRARGMRLAVDDTGAGAAGLHHILEFAPEVIKMDSSLTRGINVSPPRSALATALVSFGAATGSAILAEGIETTEESDALRRLGVGYGQGYLLGRPGSLPSTDNLLAEPFPGQGSRLNPIAPLTAAAPGRTRQRWPWFLRSHRTKLSRTEHNVLEP